MSEAALATIRCPADRLAGAIGTAALDGPGSEPHEEMFARVSEEGLTTPASAAESTQSSFCTLGRPLFDDLAATEPVEALFPVRAALDWLSWFGEEEITVTFVGERGATVASRLRLVGADRTVALDCIDDPAVLKEIRLWLPDRFDGAQFLDGEGDPAPTQIETTTGELRRVVEAVGHCAGVEQYPLAVEADELRFECDGETTTVAGTLEATVDGPAIDYLYGPGFGRVVRTLSGPVSLQATRTGQLAVVQDRQAATYRYVLQPVEE
jgi:hypothetical protein